MPQQPMPPWKVTIHRWIVASSGVPQERVRWADDSSPWPKASDGPWISLRLLGGDPGRAWTEYHRRVFSVAPQAVTAVSPGAGQLTIPSHPFLDGDGPLRVVGDDPPASLAEGVDYWAIHVASSLLSLAATFEDAINGIAIALDDAGALPLSIETTADTLRAGAEINEVTRKAGPFELGVQCRGLGSFDILEAASLKGQAPRYRALLRIANVGLLEAGGIQNVGAALNAATYEPRASMTVRLSLSFDHVDTASSVESFETEADVS